MDALVSQRRRSRKRPRSTGVEFSLQPRDWLWLSSLHRHGDLPTSYLLAYSDTLGMYRGKAEDRLTILHYEDNHPHQAPNRPAHKEGIKYLSYPQQQFKTSATNQPYVHSLGPAGVVALKKARLWRENAGFDHQWHHNFMTSTFTAAVELACLAEPTKYKYIFHDEIVRENGFCVTFESVSGKMYSPRMIGKKPVPNLVPDRFFGIKYLELGKTIYYVLETDRGTEKLGEDGDRKTLMDNIYQYREFIGAGQYEAMKLDGGLIALFLLSSPSRLKTAMTATKHSQNYIAFKAEPFWNQTQNGDPIFYVPRQVMTQLVTEPWQRKGREPFFLLNPK